MGNFVDTNELYFLQFQPIYMQRIWGGKLLQKTLQRNIPEADSTADPIGESWEITDRDDAQSVVTTGALSGKTLRELIEYYGQNLLGGLWQGGRFPLLVKFIDAGQRLSLQVHPDENYCRSVNDGSEPKTEMWYIADCEAHGEILAGLTPRATRDQLVESLSTTRAADLLQRFPSHVGDSYFIQAGTVHAIGAGNLIFEIQQNSDTTFRISDWGRLDKNGQPRQLHLEQGLRAIGFANRISPRIPAVIGETAFNRKFPLVDRYCFKVDCLRVVEKHPDNTGKLSGSFHLLSVMKGKIRLTSGSGQTLTLQFGDSALVPAIMGNYTIEPLDGAATVLKSYLA
ncbi:MAG: hypothetical protein E7052_00490 [Lentisphaerae bacterium]|nr:hypothetical protein [Lentisphaerota bacterium]